MAHKTRLPAGATISDMVRGDSQRGRSRPSGPSTRRLSPEDLRARVHNSLNVDNPPDNSSRLATDRECQIQLRITDIDPYDRNPRRTRNALFAEIKESIRVAKVLSPISVTKRPESSRYMVSAGGNTRLKAQRELWDETGDPRFEYLLVTYRPWVSEAHVLTAHLVENELHASMSFWDKAQGVWDLKRELESSTGKALSLRQLNEAMKQQGLSVSVTMLSYYGFALEHLADLGSATRFLTTYAVRDLQKPFGFFVNYLAANGLDVSDWLKIRRSVLGQFALPEAADPEAPAQQNLVPKLLIERLDQAVADAVGDASPDRLRRVRHLLATVPDASIEELLQRDQLRESTADEAKSRGEGSSGAKASNLAQSAPREPLADKAPKPSTTTAPLKAAPAAVESRATPAMDPVEHVQVLVSRFTEACATRDLLVLNSDMPCGYYMEVPADDQAIDSDPDSLRYGGWWIAAMHCGQIDGSYSDRMPPTSRWRQAQRMEAECDATTMEWLLEAVLGSPIGLVELDLWLTRVPAAVFELYHELVRAVRALRASAPQRFMLDISTGSE